MSLSIEVEFAATTSLSECLPCGLSQSDSVAVLVHVSQATFPQETQQAKRARLAAERAAAKAAERDFNGKHAAAHNVVSKVVPVLASIDAVMERCEG